MMNDVTRKNFKNWKVNKLHNKPEKWYYCVSNVVLIFTVKWLHLWIFCKNVVCCSNVVCSMFYIDVSFTIKSKKRYKMFDYGLF